MAALTYADFAAEFVELATGVTAEQNKITALLARVETYLLPSSALYGTAISTARLLLTAHFYKVLRGNDEHGNDGVGQIIQRTSGGATSISFSALAFKREQDLILSTSIYGLQLIFLRNNKRACTTGLTV